MNATVYSCHAHRARIVYFIKKSSKPPSNSSNSWTNMSNENKSKVTLKVLKNNQTLMAWLGINSHRLTEATNEFFKSIGTYYILLTVFFIFIISSAYTQAVSSQFTTVIQAWLLIVAGLQSGGMFISIGLQMKNIKILHLKLQEIVDEGKFFIH